MSNERPKSLRGGQQPLRVLYGGSWLTAREIAPLVGLSARTVRERISTGRPVHRIGRRNYGRTFEYQGAQRKAEEIAEMRGCTVGLVHYRAKHGISMDEPIMHKRRKPEAKSLLESGERRIGYGAGENGLYWDDDEEAKGWHRKHGGELYGECTLDEIGKLWSLSRERIRQVAECAYNKIRRKAMAGDKDALDALEWMRARAELRSREQPGAWEQASLNAPGNFDLTGFRDSTSYTDIARKFGHVEYETQPHVVASRTAAARRARRL